MESFPLPVLTQDQFSTYYGKNIPREDNKIEKIVYPGKKLTCPSKSRNLKKYIKAQNVFITESEGKFQHRIFGSDNQWSVLPKRLHSLCFPKIHLGSIPENNRIKIQLTDTIYQTLPYIPDEFYRQKIHKAERPTKPVTRRNKRQKTNEQKQINNDEEYFGWKVEGIQNKTQQITKESLMQDIKYAMDEIHNNKLVVKHPFENIKNINDNPEAIQTFTTIVRFVYHYVKEELRMQPIPNKKEENALWVNVKEFID